MHKRRIYPSPHTVGLCHLALARLGGAGLLCGFCPSPRTSCLRLPPHSPSRFCTCPRLVVIMLITMSSCRYSHRGLAPHKFTPMLGTRLTGRSSGRQHWPWLRHFHGQCRYPPPYRAPAPLNFGYKDFPICQAIEHHSLTASLQAIQTSLVSHHLSIDSNHVADL